MLGSIPRTAAARGWYNRYSKTSVFASAVRGAAAAAQPTATTAGAAGSVCRASTGQPAGREDRAAQVTPMEVEVKLRLEGPEAHAKVAQLLSSGHKATFQQENYFFDGSNGELNSRRVVLRVRFYDTDKKARLTLKGEQVLKDGIGIASEVEEPLDPLAARSFLSHPSALLDLDSDIMRGLKERYQLTGMVGLGGFTNVRQEATWGGHTLELDQTSYPWGTLYELECETARPEELRQELEAWLQEAGVGYRYSTVSKFANFIKKTLE